MKHCVDCKHVITTGWLFNKEYMCGLARDMVTGKPKMSCEKCREYEYLEGCCGCGYEGKKWEARD